MHLQQSTVPIVNAQAAEDAEKAAALAPAWPKPQHRLAQARAAGSALAHSVALSGCAIATPAGVRMQRAHGKHATGYAEAQDEGAFSGPACRVKSNLLPLARLPRHILDLASLPPGLQ